MQYSDTETRSLWSRLQLKIPEFFKGMDIKPSLLHGDLWSGNAAETEDGPLVSLYFQLILRNILNLLNYYLTMLNVVYIGEI